MAGVAQRGSLAPAPQLAARLRPLQVARPAAGQRGRTIAARPAAVRAEAMSGGAAAATDAVPAAAPPAAERAWSSHSWLWRGHKIRCAARGLSGCGLLSAWPRPLARCQMLLGCRARHARRPPARRPGRYVTAGCGPPVVLVHGFGASSLHYRRNIGVLADAGYKVRAAAACGHPATLAAAHRLPPATQPDTAAVALHPRINPITTAAPHHCTAPLPPTAAQVYALDLLGQGGSAKPPLPYSMELWGQQVADFLAEYVQQPAVLVSVACGGAALSEWRLGAEGGRAGAAEGGCRRGLRDACVIPACLAGSCTVPRSARAEPCPAPRHLPAAPHVTPGRQLHRLAGQPRRVGLRARRGGRPLPAQLRR